jgi:hypothetical protein
VSKRFCLSITPDRESVRNTHYDVLLIMTYRDHIPCRRHRHPFKAKKIHEHTILLLLVVIVLLSISPCYHNYVIAHPALPLPNAPPPKKLFAETNANAGGGSDGATTVHRNGQSSSPPPPSQLESIVANAKSLTADWSKQYMELTNPTLRSRYITTVTAGLAVSLAMVPEAVSFSCECKKKQQVCR